MSNIERLKWMMSSCVEVLGVAESFVRVATACTNGAGTDDFLYAAGAKNVFVACTALTARSLKCEVADARIAVGYHMGLAGWATPYSDEFAEILQDSDACLPYRPNWEILTAGMRNEVSPANLPFRARFAADIAKLIDMGITPIELPDKLDIKYGTINAWKGGHRIPKLPKQIEALEKTAALIAKLSASV